MEATQVPVRDQIIESPVSSPRGSGQGRAIGMIALLVAAALGFGAGWIVSNDDEGDDGSASMEMPPEVMETADDFRTAFETNDYALMQSVVTPRFRRPFYIGDPDGSPWRDAYQIEAYKFMDDPNVSDGDLVFYDIQTVGEPIVSGDGPWYVTRAETWREGDRPNQMEAIHTVVVVEADGTYLVDDAYFVATNVLVAD